MMDWPPSPPRTCMYHTAVRRTTRVAGWFGRAHKKVLLRREAWLRPRLRWRQHREAEETVVLPQRLRGGQQRERNRDGCTGVPPGTREAGRVSGSLGMRDESCPARTALGRHGVEPHPRP